MTFRPALLLAATLLSGSACAAVTSAFDGNWYDPAFAGQGFIFETYPKAGGDVNLVAIFFTYELDGRPSFYTASADIRGDVIEMPLYKPTLTPTSTPGIFGTPQFLPIGQLTVKFEDCGIGRVDVRFNGQNPTASILADGPVGKVRVGSGSFGVRRLGASAQVKRCTGGLIDNVNPNEASVGFDKYLLGPQFNSRIKFQRRPDAVELGFEFFNLPVGSYTLKAAGVPVAEVDATLTGNGSRAEARFRSPQTPLTYALDFDPINQSFQLEGNNNNISQNFLLSYPLQLLSAGYTTLPSSGGQSIQERESFGLNQISGTAEGAQASFRINTSLDRTPVLQELKITVEDAATGRYQVVVGGQRRGEITIENRFGTGRTFGEVIFRTPVSIGAYPLDFDPRGADIELQRNGATQFRVTR
jgi:hypothetical protein